MIKILKALSAIFSGHVKIHTGQWAEDVLIRKLIKNVSTGIYLDIGAYHPFYHSNTAGLWLKGWQGINIDANLNTINLFNKTRPKDINIHSAILPKSTIGEKRTIAIMQPTKKDLSSGVSAKGTCDIALGEARGFDETTEVPVNDIESLLNHHKINKIDYLNLDIEGCDEGVLHDFDFCKYKPTVVSVEDYTNNIDGIINSDITKHMKENGYTLVSRAGPTSIFISNK